MSAEDTLTLLGLIVILPVVMVGVGYGIMAAAIWVCRWLDKP